MPDIPMRQAISLVLDVLDAQLEEGEDGPVSLQIEPDQTGGPGWAWSAEFDNGDSVYGRTNGTEVLEDGS